jgi:hypothetical protein
LDLRISNQYVLLSVIASCFHFKCMCLHQVSLLFMESLDLRISNQYVLLSVISSCVPF